MRLSHSILVAISGLIWLSVGLFLFPLGLNLLMAATKASEGSYPLLEALSPLVGGVEQASLMIVVVCLSIGLMKGKYVLGKSAKRIATRIQTFPNPTSITNLYSVGNYILIASMVGLGMSIKFFGLSHDIRGAIDIAIGAALINGAVATFRNAYELRQVTKVSMTK